MNDLNFEPDKDGTGRNGSKLGIGWNFYQGEPPFFGEPLTLKIGPVYKNGRGDRAGIEEGDLIRAINGVLISDIINCGADEWLCLEKFLLLHRNSTMIFSIKRNTTSLFLDV